MNLNPQNTPLVSILLPTHNRADVLIFAIRSVLAQTIQNFELLIVGDGCSDNTEEVIKSFNDPRIHWFDLPKTPAFGYANRNIVLQKARGEIVAYMTHDDLWLSDHLERLLPSFFDDKKIDIVFSRPLWVIPPAMIVPGIFNLNYVPTLEIFLTVRNGIPSSCVMHRRNCFDRYGYWDDTLPMSADWDMWKRIIKNGGKENFAYLNDGTSLHFKANWRDESHDRAYGFRFWKRLFTSNQMPDVLKADINDDITEQEAIWRVMSLGAQAWNQKIRTAIIQVLDVCAGQGNFLADALLELNQELFNEPLQTSLSFGFEFSPLIKRFKQMQLKEDTMQRTKIELLKTQNELKTMQHTKTELLKTQNELKAIKATWTWKLHEYVMNIDFIRTVYTIFMKRIRQWRSSNKQSHS